MKRNVTDDYDAHGDITSDTRDEYEYVYDTNWEYYIKRQMLGPSNTK